MPIARFVPYFERADPPPSTVAPRTPPPTTTSPARPAFRIAVQLDSKGRLAQLTVWEASTEYSWSRIVIQTYGDVAADLQRPAVTSFLTATPETLVQVITAVDT